MASCCGYIYIYTYITFSPAVHAVCTRMNSPLPWPNTCFCVPVTYVCGCHCILNCVYVLKCRNTINVARQYNMSMSSQIVCVSVPMPEWNMCAHTFCMSILVVLLWHVVLSWLETDNMQQVVWVGVVAPWVFWGAISEIGFCVASCSYIYICFMNVLVWFCM